VLQGVCGRRRSGYTAHKQLRCNGPQERKDAADGQKGPPKKPPLQKGSKRTLSVPGEGLRNGAGSTKHATLARLQKGSRGGGGRARSEPEAMHLGRTLHSGTSSRAADMQTCKQNRIEGVTGRTGSYAATNPWMKGNGQTDKTDCK